MTADIIKYIGSRVHMVGIGGSSMSGLARLLQKKGYAVSGSDNYDKETICALRAEGIPVYIGHRPENVRDADLLVYSAAIHEDNPERMEAERLGIPQMERSTLLGQLMRGYRQTVCVSGTHGKTTTTAMIAQMLLDAGLSPTIHIGGEFRYIGGSTYIGGNAFFVAEACEFNASFLQMRPTVAVVLNIGEDHLDFYRDIDHITETFGQFVSLVPKDGFCVGNGDDGRVFALLQGASCNTLPYGLNPRNRLRPENLLYDEFGRASFEAVLDGKRIAQIKLQVAGDFNMLNALATVGSAFVTGADTQKAAASLSAFTGVDRRFEFTGTVSGVKLYHDYGHNPTEMRGALSMAKKQPHNRLWAVMQPHTYSRVRRLFSEYIHCCEDADEILITDIYAAREKDPGDIRSSMLVDAIAKTGQSVHLTPTFGDTEAYLRAHWQPGDLVLTMGCGNINELNERIQKNE